MGLIWFSLGLGGEILVIGDIFQIFVTFYHAVFHENLGTNQCKSGNMPTLGKGMLWVSKTFKTKTIRSCDEAKKTVMKCHDGFVGLCQLMIVDECDDR